MLEILSIFAGLGLIGIGGLVFFVLGGMAVVKLIIDVFYKFFKK